MIHCGAVVTLNLKNRSIFQAGADVSLCESDSYIPICQMEKANKVQPVVLLLRLVCVRFSLWPWCALDVDVQKISACCESCFSACCFYLFPPVIYTFLLPKSNLLDAAAIPNLYTEWISKRSESIIKSRKKWEIISLAGRCPCVYAHLRTQSGLLNENSTSFFLGVFLTDAGN